MIDIEYDFRFSSFRIGLRPVMDIVSRLQVMIEEIPSNLVTIKCYQYESLT
jgi:hypothetical protein